MSFRFQIAAVFGALVIVLMTGVSGVVARMTSAAMRHDAATSLQNLADNAARLLADGLHERFTLVKSLAASESLWEAGLAGPQVAPTLQREQTLRSDLAWMGVADLNAEVKAATGNLLLGANVRSRPWYGAGLSAPMVGDLHPAKLLAGLLPSASDGEPQRFVDFAAPIKVQGRTLGVLALHGSWDWSRNTVEALLPRDAAERGIGVFIFDRHGAVLHAPGNRTHEFADADQRLPGEAAAASGVPSVRSWVDGEGFLTAVAAVRQSDAEADLGWHVAVRVPAHRAFAAAETAFWNVVLIGIGASVSAVIFAWWVAGSICEPLSSIARAAGEVERGRAGAHIPNHRGNRELAGLSSALGAMTRRLLETNEALEARVRTRTAELEAANAHLDHLSRSDTLTGVLNRRGFEEQMRAATAAARRRAAPLSIVMLDIDHFKKVNDSHGHAAGDDVLQCLCALMRERLRESDAIGRLGGEEFAALLPDTDAAGALRVAEDLVLRVAATDLGVVGSVTISCGVADVVADEDGYAALKRADLALYHAKATGRNRAVPAGQVVAAPARDSASAASHTLDARLDSIAGALQPAATTAFG